MVPIDGITSEVQLAGDFTGCDLSELFPAEDLRRERRANDKPQDQSRNIAHVDQPRVALPNSLKQRHCVGERQDPRDDLQLRRKRIHGDEESREADHRIKDERAYWL